MKRPKVKYSSPYYMMSSGSASNLPDQGKLKRALQRDMLKRAQPEIFGLIISVFIFFHTTYVFSLVIYYGVVGVRNILNVVNLALGIFLFVEAIKDRKARKKLQNVEALLNLQD